MRNAVELWKLVTGNHRRFHVDAKPDRLTDQYLVFIYGCFYSRGFLRPSRAGSREQDQQRNDIGKGFGHLLGRSVSTHKKLLQNFYIVFVRTHMEKVRT